MESRTKKPEKNDFELVERPGHLVRLGLFMRKHYIPILVFLGLVLAVYGVSRLLRRAVSPRPSAGQKAYVIISYNKILYKTDKIKNKNVLDAIEAYETGYLEKSKFLLNAALQQNLPPYDRKAALVNLATIFDDLSQYDLALNYLTQAVAVDGKDGVIHHNLGILHKHRKDFKNAVLSFGKAVRYNKGFVKSYLSLASLYVYLNDPQKALEVYRKAERLAPDSGEIKYNIAICLLKQNKKEEGLRYLEKILDAEYIPEKVRGESAKSLGAHYAGRGDYEKALFYFNKAARIREDYDLFYKLGLLYKLMGKYQEALDNFVRAHEMNSKNSMTLRNLAELYYRFGENEKALRYYRYLIDTVKAGAETYLMMAEIHYRTGDRENAVLHYRKAVEAPATPDEAKIAYMNLGRIYFEKQDYTASLGVYAKALEIDRSDPEIYYSMSLIHLKNNDYEGALKYINDITRLDPNGLKGLTVKARILEQAGKTDLARIEYEKIIEKFPGEIMPYFELGTFYFKKRDYARAEHCFNRALELKPGVSYLYKVHLNLAVIYSRMKEWKKAFERIKEAHLVNPRDALVNYNYGLFYMENRDYARASDHFHQVLRLDAEDHIKALASLSIGNIHFLEGKRGLARSLYEKALKFDPRLTEAHYNLKKVLGSGDETP